MSMRIRFSTLTREILTLMPSGIIALTGGGGKSMLMQSLGTALAHLGNEGKGARVLLTTTTRIFRPEARKADYFMECRSPDDIELPKSPCTLTAARPAGSGQNPEYLCGFSKEEVDTLWQRRVADWIIVEADGAARRPLKAPAEKEPVIPSETRAVIAVAGLCGLNQPFADPWVFRPGPFTALTGLKPGELLLPEAVAHIFFLPGGLFKESPAAAKRLVFLNQADIPEGLEAALPLARSILAQANPPLDGVYGGCARQTEVPCLSFEKEEVVRGNTPE